MFGHGPNPYVFIGKLPWLKSLCVDREILKSKYMLKSPWSQIIKKHGQTNHQQNIVNNRQTHGQQSSKTIINNRQKHCQQSSNDMVKNHQNTWSQIIKKHGVGF
jgi:hypothetical protein